MNTKLFLVAFFSIACSMLAVDVMSVEAFQIIPIQAEFPGVEVVDDQAEDAKKTEQDEDPHVDEPLTDTAAQTKTEDLGDEFIRFHMWDGSIVGGNVTVASITVETEFGSLRIPIKQIMRFYPGLNSIPALNSKIAKLVEGLGDKNFDVRESSHRELVGMGLLLRNEIQHFGDDGSAERKKHLAEIKKQIDEMSEEINEIDNDEVERALVRGDLIVTPEFSIVGKIKQDEFLLNSKFGELSVNLGDIKMADRTFNLEKQDIRKSVEVSGMAFFQTKPVSTKIRVNRGDKISIRASGVVQWTNWSNSSGPNGIENQGQWQGSNCGTLMARVGNGNDYISIGEKGEFTAKQSGVLYLGVAMRDNYAQENSYRWEGEYTAKILVKPAQ